ncbi:hypothetical protein BdWA1_001254 [Babesia duncani]|uniref:Uncharacterized protein n=1 Tax=Babesia duncani TaxID=323732 RepID=A0AAD9PNP4_9APIC|nr:hypothetical protein BdWA1_001254 [Babesia duncani]
MKMPPTDSSLADSDETIIMATHVKSTRTRGILARSFLFWIIWSCSFVIFYKQNDFYQLYVNAGNDLLSENPVDFLTVVPVSFIEQSNTTTMPNGSKNSQKQDQHSSARNKDNRGVQSGGAAVAEKKNVNPFHPYRKHSFKDFDLHHDGEMMSLLDKQGSAIGHFAYPSKHGTMVQLIAEMMKSKGNHCHIKWIPSSKKNKAGHIHFSCNGNIPANAFSGETPIMVKIEGASEKTSPTIYLSSNGYNFKSQFPNLRSIKEAIMVAMGADASRDCEIVTINGKSYSNDEKAYKAIMNHVMEGSKFIKIIIKPKIRLVANVKEPFASAGSNHMSAIGDFTLKEYTNLLKSDKQMEKIAKEKLNTEATGFTLMSINDEVLQGKKTQSQLSKLPVNMDVRWTFVPYININFHFLEAFGGDASFQMRTTIKEAINKGSNVLRRFLKKKYPFKLYAYSLPGCLQEEVDHKKFLKAYGKHPIYELPFSDTCGNKEVHTINFYYLNEKPEKYHFEVVIQNPDGSPSQTRKITGKYIEETTLGDIKDAIVKEFENTGSIITKNDLEFVDLRRSDFKPVTNDTKLKSLKDIAEDQKMGRVSRLVLKGNPLIKGFFIDPKGKEEKLDIHLKTIYPTIDDIKSAFEDSLHSHNLLKPQESIHGSVSFHPMDKKSKINKNVTLPHDETGHFLPGTKTSNIAVEADSRVEMPISFIDDNGKIINLKVHIPYGAPTKTIEDLIKKELKKSGYSGDLPQLSITINGKSDIDYNDMWDGRLDPQAFLTVRPAKTVQVEGMINGHPTNFPLKIHAHESMDDLDRDVLASLEHSHIADDWLKSDPEHIKAISALIMAQNGDRYDDDTAGDHLYKHVNTVKIGVSDHPLDLVWKDPLDGKQSTYCLSKRPDGTCRGVSPTILSKFNVQTIGDFLLNIIKKQDPNMYSERIASVPKANKHFTSSVKLSDIILINNQTIDCSDTKPTDTLPMIEETYGFSTGHIRALVFTLMTKQEQSNMLEMLKSSKTHPYHIQFMKQSGDNEKYDIDLQELGPGDIESSIFKYFPSVPYGSNILHTSINGKEYPQDKIGVVMKQLYRDHEPIHFGFDVENDKKHGPRIVVKTGTKPMRIQPKYNETMRDFFTRAEQEPGDFGLQPFHSYQVLCIDNDGNPIQVDGLLDTPLMDITTCKELQLKEQPANRIDDSLRLLLKPFSFKEHLKKPLVLDESKDSIQDINNKLRMFLMSVPEDEMNHVNIVINDKTINCSLAGLRDAYRIKYLTMDTLMSICNASVKASEPAILRLNLNIKPEEIDKSKTMQYLNGPNHGGEEKPIALFTLHKGQSDLGITSMIDISTGSLKSPVYPFFNKINAMFGKSIDKISNIQISVIKSGRSYPCNNMNKLSRLSDFKRIHLMDIFTMCNIPVHVPQPGTFYHFHVAIPFGDNISHTSDGQMGGHIPALMKFQDDEMMTTLGYDEDLRLPLSQFVHENPNVDMSHLNRYNITIKEQEPNNKVHTKTYNLEKLPSHMSLNSIFPHHNASNISFELDDDVDLYTSGGDWKTQLNYPVNDYKDNFDQIRNQIIMNLKSMHGNDLRNLQGYKVAVDLNGQRHQCHIKNLAELETMNMKEFMENCVNIENIENNPTMSFRVNYDSQRGKPQIILKCQCNDMETLVSNALKPDSLIPADFMNQLSNKYGHDKLPSVMWGVIINGIQGNCHVNDITTSFTMNELLESCGVSDDDGLNYWIELRDVSLDYMGSTKVGINIEQGKPSGAHVGGDYSPLYAPGHNLMHQTIKMSEMEPNVFINMPSSYHGQQEKIDGHNSLNDYTRRILIDEDMDSPGKPINIKMNVNGHKYNWGQVPNRELNYPSGHLNGNISIVVNEDESDSLPGTFHTFHFPEKEKPLSTFLKVFRERLADPDKKILLITPRSLIPESNIPRHLLTKSVKELRDLGYAYTVLNDPMDAAGAGAISISLLSRDGVNTSSQVVNLQNPLRDVVAKLSTKEFDPTKLGDAKFRIIIDGIDTNCTVPALDTLLTTVTVQDILTSCGIQDFTHGHELSLYFDKDLGTFEGTSAHGFKIDVDLDDKVESSRNVNYDYELDVGQGPMDYLKKTPGASVFFDFEGKGGFKEFVEVDTEKFKQLLGAHPTVVDLLLKMGVPQDHLGGVESLKIILSSLSHALKGHQFFSVNTIQDSPFSDDEPLSKHESITNLAQVLMSDKDQNVKVTVQLTNGNVKEFMIPNNEFLHAIRGNLTFKQVVLWGVPSSDAAHLKHVHFDTAPIPVSGTRKGAPPKTSKALSGGNMRAGVLTTKTKLSEIGLLKKAIADNNRNVVISVNTNNGKKLDVVVKSSMLKNSMDRGENLAAILRNFLNSKDIDGIKSLSLRMEDSNEKFFVPLKRHEPVAMPVMASDEPKTCMIQEFKNAWNPPENVWKHLTLKQAVDAYRKYYRMPTDMQLMGLYLLRKEMMHNISALIIFDESHPVQDQIYNRNFGQYADAGYTLFMRFRNSGELVI